MAVAVVGEGGIAGSDNSVGWLRVGGEPYACGAESLFFRNAHGGEREKLTEKNKDDEEGGEEGECFF